MKCLPSCAIIYLISSSLSAFPKSTRYPLSCLCRRHGDYKNDIPIHSISCTARLGFGVGVERGVVLTAVAETDGERGWRGKPDVESCLVPSCLPKALGAFAGCAARFVLLKGTFSRYVEWGSANLGLKLGKSVGYSSSTSRDEPAKPFALQARWDLQISVI
jgi:hypothetical protein